MWHNTCVHHIVHISSTVRTDQSVFGSKKQRDLSSMSLTAFVRKTLRTVVGGESCAENFVFNALWYAVQMMILSYRFLLSQGVWSPSRQARKWALFYFFTSCLDRRWGTEGRYRDPTIETMSSSLHYQDTFVNKSLTLCLTVQCNKCVL